MRTLTGSMLAVLLTGGAVACSTASGVPAEAPAPPVTRPAPPPPGVDPRIKAVLAWTLGGLPAGFADAVGRLPDVASVAVVRGGNAWLTGWGEPGSGIRNPPSGLMLPVDVAAVDPAEYAKVIVPHRLARAVSRLRSGEALVSGTELSIRGGMPSELRFGSTHLRVRGVLDDHLAGGHEIVVSTTTGAALGVTEPRYLLALPRPGVPAARVEPGVRSVAPAGVALRTRTAGETSFLREADLTLPPVRLKALFGEFAAAPRSDGFLDVDESWKRRWIETARMPVLGEVTCNRRILPLVRGAFRELERRGLDRFVDASDYAGCYAPRYIARDPGAGLSHHSWGVAFDINVSTNPLGAEPTLDMRVVRVIERWGFVWGGRFIRPDGMHFEFRCFPEHCGN